MAAQQINQDHGPDAEVHLDILRKDGVAKVEDTDHAIETEHERTFWQAFRQFPKAVFWSAFFSIAVVTAGFDAQIVTSFYALPAFQRRFGTIYENEYIISAPWQTALGMGNPIGQLLGAVACGWPLERFGRRRVLAMCSIWSIAFVFNQFFATSIGALCVGEILGGLVYGFYEVIGPLYASEVCPLALRGVLTATTNLAFVVGQFVAQGCAAGVESRTDAWAYKIPFAIQWVWPTVLLIGLVFAPESPYWLIRKGRKDDARKSLVALSSKSSGADIDLLLDMIERTDLLERELEQTSSYRDCFKGTNWIRTEISTVIFLIPLIAGNPFLGYANFFFETAGLSPASSFDMGVGNTALGFVGTCLSWVFLCYFGRRTIFHTGLVLMTIILFVIGFLDFGRSNVACVWAQASLMQVWTFLYQTAIGPVVFVVVAEVSATRLRAHTIAIATAVQAFFSIVYTIAMPYMLTPNEADWRGKAGFLFGGVSLVCCIWSYFRLPECRGCTFEEIDLLFERHVKPRHFKRQDLRDDLVVKELGAD